MFMSSKTWLLRCLFLQIFTEFVFLACIIVIVMLFIFSIIILCPLQVS